MKPKGRHTKPRSIEKEPRITIFSPRGRPGRPDEISLKYEELEALRLADYKGIKQEKAARYMKVSRQTFGRVLKEARKALADALVNGKIIKIRGGSYRLNSNRAVRSKAKK